MARPSEPEYFDSLRRKAEERLRELGVETEHPARREDAVALLHELSVHQIELEMQNEELRHAREQTEQALERYAELYDFAPVGYLTLDKRGIVVRANLTGARLLGLERGGLIGQSIMLHLAQSGRGVFLRFLDEVFQSGGPAHCEVEPRRGSDACLRFEGVIREIPPHEGPQCWVAVSNITQAKIAEAALRHARDELEQRVTERTSELAAANDSLRWLREQAENREAELKSYLSTALDGLILVDAGGKIAFANDAGTQMLSAAVGEPITSLIARLSLYTPEGRPLPPHALPTCRALEGETIKEETHRIVQASGREYVVSASAAPIVDAEGEVIGAASVFHDVTEKTAWEKRKDEVYEREHRVASVLQRALVPPEIKCAAPGVEIAVEYQAASEEAKVGGDFYDVIDLDEGRIGVLIGDVVGKGLDAAIRVAAVRYAVRSYAYLNPSPGLVMTRANDALCRDTEEGLGVGQMLTGLFLVVDPQQRTVMHANGGHEPPFVVRPDGLVREVKVQGQILGVVPGYCYPEATLRLEPGDIVVVLTDGITEAGRNSEMLGVDGVLDILSLHASESPAEIARALLEEALSRSSGKLRDDAAILALRLS